MPLPSGPGEALANPQLSVQPSPRIGAIGGLEGRDGRTRVGSLSVQALARLETAQPVFTPTVDLELPGVIGKTACGGWYRLARAAGGAFTSVEATSGPDVVKAWGITGPGSSRRPSPPN